MANDLSIIEDLKVTSIQPTRDWKALRINYQVLSKLCQIGCSNEELAYVCGTDVPSLMKKIDFDLGMNLTKFRQHNKQMFSISLRRKQFEKAMEGDTKMLIHLGKCYLGQVEGKGEQAEDTLKKIPNNVLVQIINSPEKKQIIMEQKNEEVLDVVREEEGSSGEGVTGHCGVHDQEVQGSVVDSKD